MAVSPLAQVDWNNLDGEDSNTVMDLLQRAYNERLAVANTVNNDAISFFPFPDDNQQNNPDWGETGTASAWHWTNYQIGFQKAIRSMCTFYLDKDFITDNIDTVIPVLGNTDLVLSEAKVWAKYGLTEWPRVMNPNTDELKLWYDILSEFTHIRRVQEHSGVTTPDKVEFSGVLETGGFTPAVVKYRVGGTPPVSQIPSDWAQLYAGPEARATYSSSTSRIYFMSSTTALGIYDLTALKRWATYDISALDDAGYIRLPKDYVAYGQYEGGANGGAVGWLSDNGITINELVEFDTTVGRTVDDLEITINNPSLTDPPDISTQPNLVVLQRFSFFENWNDNTGATGFQYYTP